MNSSKHGETPHDTIAVTCCISSTGSAKGEVLQAAWPDLVDRDSGRFPENLVTPEQRELQESTAGTMHGLAVLQMKNLYSGA